MRLNCNHLFTWNLISCSDCAKLTNSRIIIKSTSQMERNCSFQMNSGISNANALLSGCANTNWSIDRDKSREALKMRWSRSSAVSISIFDSFAKFKFAYSIATRLSPGALMQRIQLKTRICSSSWTLTTRQLTFFSHDLIIAMMTLTFRSTNVFSFHISPSERSSQQRKK